MVQVTSIPTSFGISYYTWPPSTGWPIFSIKFFCYTGSINKGSYCVTPQTKIWGFKCCCLLFEDWHKSLSYWFCVFYSSKVSNRWFIYLLGITIKEIANIQIIPPMWSRRKLLKKQNIIIIQMHIALITFRIIVSLFFSSIFLIILLCLFQKGRFKDNLQTDVATLHHRFYQFRLQHPLWRWIRSLWWVHDSLSFP